MGYTVIGFADIGKSNNGENHLSNRQRITLLTVRFQTVRRGQYLPVINMRNIN